MHIPTRKRPWTPSSRSNKNPFYRSRRWKDIRTRHINSYSVVDGMILDNKYCIECFKQNGKRIPMHTVDHIVPILDGGPIDDPNNLQSLCLSHNAKKTAEDGLRRQGLL